MKRFVQSVATAAAGCALVVSGAGIASAGGGVPQQGGHERAGHVQYIQQSYGGHKKHRHGHHRAGNVAVAKGYAKGSPGFLSGNVIQVPINIPINACGNSLNLFALLNPAFGNRCVNGSIGGK
ncbi:chaplin [Streptomyces sp. NPDC059008]|uniref:chaplin n=1 Tax=unclassified Streptomyces TaxID=2593676 RepID=UPI0036AA2449